MMENVFKQVHPPRKRKIRCSVRAQQWLTPPHLAPLGPRVPAHSQAGTQAHSRAGTRASGRAGTREISLYRGRTVRPRSLVYRTGNVSQGIYYTAPYFLTYRPGPVLLWRDVRQCPSPFTSPLVA
jgi:hypothetical protein